MADETIKEAAAEAKRFLRRVKEYDSSRTVRSSQYKGKTYTYSIHKPIESGALRRSSMDLTRALAKMRRY